MKSWTVTCPTYLHKLSLLIKVPSITVSPWTWHPYPSTVVDSISLWFTRTWSELSLGMKLVEGKVLTCHTLCRYSHQCVSIFAINRPNWCKLMQAGDQASRKVYKYRLLPQTPIVLNDSLTLSRSLKLSCEQSVWAWLMYSNVMKRMVMYGILFYE